MWKARRDAYEQHGHSNSMIFHKYPYLRAIEKTAKYEERVEHLIRL